MLKSNRSIAAGKPPVKKRSVGDTGIKAVTYMNKYKLREANEKSAAKKYFTESAKRQAAYRILEKKKKKVKS